MARNTRSVRLVLALSVAGVLAVFLVYVSIAGGRTPQLAPSQLQGHQGKVSLVGRVVGPVHGEGYSRSGLRFGIVDIGKNAGMAVPVTYHGSVPDLFKVGRHIVVDGTYRHGVFVAKRDTLVTKCPSKYSPKKS
ncbi:MAG TPA: cytochrome c maturation protein CcmE [Gaiellaceae bacterium]|nr:cytochrome c maturation protein CcmE [Gaiellaceae bacterium]